MNTNLAHRATVPQKLDTQLDFVLLDGSSSMADKWWDMLDAIETYVNGLKTNNINSQIVLTTFDGAYPDYTHRDVNIAAWQPLPTNPIGSFGGTTPLYDAISLMGQRLKDLDPPRASIVIVTDGEENASQFTDLIRAKAILDWMRAKGWQVTFIGANFNNSQQASLLGGHPASAIGVSTQRLADATGALAAKRARYGLYGEPMHFSDDEKQEFGGFLGGPSPK